MPICPYCNEEITLLYSSPRRDLIFYNGRWVSEASNNETNAVCSVCYEELGPKDLDKLAVPNTFR
jgi:hypothetical protein